MKLKSWRHAIHNLIVTMGFMALVAIMTEATANGNTGQRNFNQSFFTTAQFAPSNLSLEKCHNTKWIDELLGLNQSRINDCFSEGDKEPTSKSLFSAEINRSQDSTD